MKEKYSVTVAFPGRGRIIHGVFLEEQQFRDEAKARDHYTDMLLMFPGYEVTFTKL